jgi:hypothetical protein
LYLGIHFFFFSSFSFFFFFFLIVDFLIFWFGRGVLEIMG